MDLVSARLSDFFGKARIPSAALRATGPGLPWIPMTTSSAPAVSMPALLSLAERAHR